MTLKDVQFIGTQPTTCEVQVGRTQNPNLQQALCGKLTWQLDNLPILQYLAFNLKVNSPGLILQGELPVVLPG